LGKKLSDKESSKGKVNVQDWITLSVVMIGCVLTILALIWQAKPSSGILTVSFFLMLAFILFVNSVTSNSKAHFEANLPNTSEKRVKRFVSFAEYTFGLAFTFVIIAFAILSYKYLLDFTNRNILALLIPTVFLSSAWIIMMIYNSLNYAGKTLKSLSSFKRIIWILMEAVTLILIFLDYYRTFLIP